MGGTRLASMDSGFFLQNKQLSKPLNYPLHPLRYHTSNQPYNVVVIAIDTWRYDMMNAVVTPHIAQFSQRAWNFRNHYSGGDSTQPGIFSLFYSIPANYWTAALQQKQGSVFIQALLQHHYQMGIFSSASLHFPAFDETVFRDINHLQVETPGDNSAQRDQRIVKELEQFIKHKDQSRPFFSFLFFDAVHGFYDSDTHQIPQPFQPSIQSCNRLVLTKHSNPIPYLNRYKNAVRFDDQLVGKVLAKLKQRHLLQKTIVIITADHGEEFNDEGLGYWGHASAFDPYQVRTPLIVYWPHTQPREIHYQTSHYDIVPTLMTRMLGSLNAFSDYSVGTSLLTKGHRPYLIVGSYVDYAILQKNRITTIYPGGDYAVSHMNGRTIPGARLDMVTFQKVFRDLNKYFK